MSWARKEVIGDCTLYQGDCLESMSDLAAFDHAIFDPPYEASLHESKNSLRGPVRVDSGPDLKGLNFAPIDEIRVPLVTMMAPLLRGWFLAFCTIEGVAEWANAINASPMKYKRGCVWVKPDSTPQLNGQGPAQGAECFITAWAGNGHAKWNAGGKRGAQWSAPFLYRCVVVWPFYEGLAHVSLSSKFICVGACDGCATNISG